MQVPMTDEHGSFLRRYYPRPADTTSLVGRSIVERRVIQLRIHLVIVFEHDGRAGVLQQAWIGRGMFDDRAARGEASTQDRDAAFRIDGIVERAYDVVVVHLGSGDILAQRAPGDSARLQIEERREAR